MYLCNEICINTYQHCVSICMRTSSLKIHNVCDCAENSDAQQYDTKLDTACKIKYFPAICHGMKNIFMKCVSIYISIGWVFGCRASLSAWSGTKWAHRWSGSCFTESCSVEVCCSPLSECLSLCLLPPPPYILLTCSSYLWSVLSTRRSALLF